MHRSFTRIRHLLLALATLLVLPATSLAAPASSGVSLPNVSLHVGGQSADPGTNLSLLALFTLITLAPSLLIMTTGFTRILIVMSFMRNALGAQQMPPNQILVGFSLFLTLFVMAPTFGKVNDTALQPYLNKKITAQVAIERAEKPVKAFMLKQTRASDLQLFVRLSKDAEPRTREQVKLTTLIPAFMVSELKTAFEIGFLIYIPFLIIDLVVASTLMSMGMMMLPPVLVSLPFKLLLFVLVDGWALIAQSLVAGFHT
jgi:flagellar biosynthetic protein FliP